MAEAKTPDERHGGITLPEFAELSALARLPAPPFADMLAARGLSPDSWRDARAAWNQAIEAHLERGDDALVLAFATALADAKERFRREPPRAPEIAASPARAAPVTSPAITPSPVVFQPITPSPVVSQPIAPSLVAFQPITPAPVAVQPVTLSPIAPASITQAPIEPAPITLSPVTVPPITQPPITRPPMTQSPASAPVDPSTEAPRPGGTGEVVVPRVSRKVLPFVQRDAPVVPRDAPVAPASVAPASVAAPPQLTIEQYASLTAELAEAPERAAEVRARYLVAQDAAWSAMQAEWQRRLSADPRLRQRVADLVAHYRAWLHRKGG